MRHTPLMTLSTNPANHEPLKPRLSLALSLALVCIALPVSAQAPEPITEAPPELATTSEATLERVVVGGSRSVVMPYQNWIKAAAPIHEISHGLLRFGARLYSQDTSRPLRVSVLDEDKDLPIAPLLGQLYVVPHDLPVQPQHADFSINRAEGQWGVGNFALVPQLTAQTPDMASVRQVLQAYQALYRKQFPLSWRLLSRSEASFDVCTPREGETLHASQADGTELASLRMDQKVKDHGRTTGRTLYCASIKANTDWGDQVRLKLPAQAIALLGFRLI